MPHLAPPPAAAAGEDEPVNVLIVDDKPANIVTLEAILGRSDYNLVTATSGQEALKYVLLLDFAVILLDLMMPEMDGFEFARLVKQRARVATTPIIFLAAIATEPTYLMRGYSVGAVDYLQKPLIPEIVTSKVAVFVDLFRKNQRIRKQEAALREVQRMEQERRLSEVRQASEHHYLELADAIPQIVWTADAEGNLRYFNKKWFTYSGLEPSSMVDTRQIREVAHPDDVGWLARAWTASVARGEPFEHEVRLREAASGRFRWHLCRGVPERSRSGEIVGWLGTYTDIHAQKRVEESHRFLAEAGAKLASTQDVDAALTEIARIAVPAHADACCIELTLPGRKPFTAIVSRAEEDVAHLFRAPEEPEMRELPAAEPGQAPSLVVAAPITVRGRRAGAIHFVDLGCKLLDRADLDLLVETSRMVAVAVENVLIHEETLDNNRRKDEFLAVLSHELRTPLNAVIGWTELMKLDALEAETPDERLIDGLGIVEQNAKSLARLVAELLDVSRIITGKLALQPAPIEMGDFLAGVAATVKPLADEKGVVLKTRIPSARGSGPTVLGDTSRLQQVFWNLLTNAIKFTEEGGTVELAMSVPDPQRVVVTVRDTGIGIAEDLLAHVFDRFRQADSSRTRKHGGLGLGLSIVKYLVESHRGEVKVESEGYGKGSLFTVELPALTAEQFVPLVVEGGESVDGPTVELAGRAVLLVDDDKYSRALVATMLRHAGAAVVQASSVAEAMAQVERAPPEIVLTDIGMPDEDGFALLAKLRDYERAAGAKIPKVAVTAYASEEDRRAALGAGFDRYLTKPIRPAELVQVVSALLREGEAVAEGGAGGEATP